jgi:hypothetical protein
LDRNHLFVAIVLVSMVNGLFSPALLAVIAAWPVWYPSGLVAPAPAVLVYLGSLILSAATLLVSGIPAALHERTRDLKDSDGSSLMVWLVGALVLTAPTFLALAGVA